MESISQASADDTYESLDIAITDRCSRAQGVLFDTEPLRIAHLTKSIAQILRVHSCSRDHPNSGPLDSSLFWNERHQTQSLPDPPTSFLQDHYLLLPLSPMTTHNLVIEVDPDLIASLKAAGYSLCIGKEVNGIVNTVWTGGE